MKLLRSGIDTKVIALSSFRVGDPNFASFYNEMTTDHYRVVVNKDFAVHFTSQMEGYKHTATEFYLEADTVTMR
jgi:predicted lipase